MRILVPLVVGWIVFFPMIWPPSSWGAAGRCQTPRPRRAPPAGTALAFPLAHLWFLYVLTLLYAAALPVRAAGALDLDAGGRLRARLDAGLRVALRGPWAPFVLARRSSVAFLVSPWLLLAGIPTPDQSLIPNLPAAVGVLVGLRRRLAAPPADRAARALERQWALHLGGGRGADRRVPVRSPASNHRRAPRRLRSATAVYTRAIRRQRDGLDARARRRRAAVLPAESAGARYVSDASYWIYLAHLPL